MGINCKGTAPARQQTTSGASPREKLLQHSATTSPSISHLDLQLESSVENKAKTMLESLMKCRVFRNSILALLLFLGLRMEVALLSEIWFSAYDQAINTAMYAFDYLQPQQQQQQQQQPSPATTVQSNSDAIEKAISSIHSNSKSHCDHQLYYDNVVLLGQFNTAISPSLVIYWVGKWSKYFKHIEVHGPFNSLAQDVLRSNGIQVFAFDAKSNMDTKGINKGLYSPMRTLASGLRRHKSSSDIRGVLIIHDDLIFDVAHVKKQGLGSSSDIIFHQGEYIAGRYDHPYLYFTANYTVRVANEAEFKTIRKAHPEPRHWRWWKVNCLNSIAKGLAMDPRGKVYMDTNGDGTFHASQQHLADFVYIPTKYADDIVDMAQWLADSKVFLECAIPTMIGHLGEYHDAKASTVRTCTHQKGMEERLRYNDWVPNLCWSNNSKPFQVFHPLKIAAYSMEDNLWGSYFDSITTASC